MSLDKSMKWFLIFSLIFSLEWIFLALNVVDRQAWALENILVLIAFWPIYVYSKQNAFTKTSYVFLFIFFTLHCIGAHYTYSLVPYNRWFESVFGIKFNTLVGWQRNNYDRIIHFLFGLLIFLPLRQLFARATTIRSSRLSAFTALFLVFLTTVYELIEWGIAEIFSNANITYVGTQGDPWDSQKDQALAILGLIISYVLFSLIKKGRYFFK